MQDLHPILVHVPVAVIPLSALFGLWLILSRRNPGIRTAFRVCLVVAALFAIMAVMSGDRAEDHVEDVVPHDLLEEHEEFGILTLWLILIATAIELASLIPKLKPRAFPLSSLAFVVTLAAVVTVVFAGPRGAEMVYRYGGGVGHVFEAAPGVAVPAGAIEAAEDHSVADED